MGVRRSREYGGRSCLSGFVGLPFRLEQAKRPVRMPKRHSNHAGNLESLFLRLEELVLANSGEDEFEEVFKLLVAKVRDERGGKRARFRPYETETETYRAVVTLLRQAEKAWPGILDPGTTPKLRPEHLHV